MIKKMRSWFKKIAYRVAVVQTVIILAVIYYVISLPYGVTMRIFSDRLRLKCKKNRITNWVDISSEDVSDNVKELEKSTTKGY